MKPAAKQMAKRQAGGFDFFERLEAAAVASMTNRVAAKDYLAHRAAGVGPEAARACIDARYFGATGTPGRCRHWYSYDIRTGK